MPRKPSTKSGPGKKVVSHSNHCTELETIRDQKAEALVVAHAAVGEAEGNLTIAQMQYEIAEMNYQNCLQGG